MSQPEEFCHMMILQYCPVIVEDGKRGTRLDVEVVGGAGVVIVMNDGREEERKNLEIRQPVLDASLWNKPVRGLQHIASVQVIVVGISVLGIAQLQMTQQDF